MILFSPKKKTMVGGGVMTQEELRTHNFSPWEDEFKTLCGGLIPVLRKQGQVVLWAPGQSDLNSKFQDNQSLLKDPISKNKLAPKLNIIAFFLRNTKSSNFSLCIADE